MDYKSEYSFWTDNEYFNQSTKDELNNIKNDDKEIQDRFYKNLEFGTGGLRGIIGAGTNRINVYTVRRVSQGIANVLISKGKDYVKRGIAIAYDSRHYSDKFAFEAARVFAGNGIKVYIFDELRPVPELSFAVRKLNAAAGIVITASHNPKEYNGYKVYGEDGGQLPLKEAEHVIEEMSALENITKVNIMNIDESKNNKMIEIIGEEIDSSYMDALKKLVINPELIAQHQDKIRILYTPIHGSGNKSVRRILDEVGIKNVSVFKLQEMPDPDFSTVKSPNPEDIEAFKFAIEEAKNTNMDIILGTDPDGDRVGVMVKDLNNEYKLLTGNQIGLLLMEYILGQLKQRGELPNNGFVVKTIVTTELTRKIADNYGVELLEVLTGFKFIGEKIKELDEFGDKKYLFGFEESFGYLAGTDVRDKDAVVACMLISEMAIMYKSNNMTLIDGMNEIYNKYGTMVEDLTSYTLKGKDGLDKIKNCMNSLRESKQNAFNGIEFRAVRDYNNSERYDIINSEVTKIDLPISDVLYYELGDGSWFCIRPSGTEPKIKIYYSAFGDSINNAQDNLEKLKNSVLKSVEKLIL